MRSLTKCLVLVSFIYSNNSWDEILKYSAYFGGIHVANATLKSKDSTTSKGERIFTIEFKAKSKSSFNYIFPINDIVKIDLYRDSWEPIRVKKDLSEGNYSHRSIAQFNHVEKYLVFKNDTIDFSEKLMNPYSLIYFFRTKILNPDTSYQVNIVDNKKIIPLSFTIQDKEKIKTPIGNFSAKKISPKRKDGKPFKNAGKMIIWYSEKDKIPVMINLKLKFGSLNLELVKIN